MFDDEDLGAASKGEQDSINERNHTRAQLRSAFKSIQTLALPSPHEDIDGKVVGHVLGEGVGTTTRVRQHHFENRYWECTGSLF